MSPTNHTNPSRLRRALALVLVGLGLAGAGGGYWLKASAGPARATELELARAARTRNQQALESLVRELEPHASATANVQELINALEQEVDAKTFQDLFETEEWWERVRRTFALSAVVAGGDVVARVGARTVPLEASPVVAAARERELASGLTADDETVYVLAAAAVSRAKSVANRRPTLVLGRVADETFLQQLAARTGDAVMFASRGKLRGFGGHPELRTPLGALVGQETYYQGAGEGRPLPALGTATLASAITVGPGLWLWIAFPGPVSGGWPPAAVILLGLGGLLAAVGAALLVVGGPGRGVAAHSPSAGASGGAFAAAYLATPPAAASRSTSPGHAARDPRSRADVAPSRVRSARNEDQTSEHKSGSRGTPLTAALAMTAPRGQPHEMGRYRLLKLIGEGGMAEVYIATAHGAEGFERNFVVKRLHPHLAGRKEIVSQFIDEARLQARLLHSNIVSVFDFGRAGDEYFLALEHVHGRDLERVMQRHVQLMGRPLSLSIVFFVAHEILEALAYAHARGSSTGTPLGIVHRDVSPSNVLVSFLGEVKLSDFGIVKADNRVSQTDVGMVKGNVSYMSPEQARGESVDQRSDLFSLGMLMFYCLMGRSLYASETPVNQLMRAAVGPVAEQFAELENLPPTAQEILRKALARDPAERYQSAIEFSRALVGFTSGARNEMADLMKDLYPEEMKNEF